MNPIQKNKNGISTKFITISRSKIALKSFNNKKSLTLKFSNGGIIKKIPAKKHSIVLKSSHQVR
jgi:hypothetical protein